MGGKDTKFGQNDFSGGLNRNAKIDDNELQECTNCDISEDGVIRPVYSDSKIVTSSSISSIKGLGDNVYYNIGTTLYRYDVSAASSTSLGTIGASTNLDGVHWNDEFNIIMASDKMYKDINGTLSTLGTTAPSTAPTLALSSQKSRDIELFEDHTTWTASGVSKSNNAADKKQGTNSLLLEPSAADTLGYVYKTLAIDLSQYADSTTSDDDDFIQFWMFVEQPSVYTYAQIFFDINTGDFKNDMYWKTIPMLPVAFDSTLNEDIPDTYDDLVRQRQDWTDTLNKWKNKETEFKKAVSTATGKKQVKDWITTKFNKKFTITQRNAQKQIDDIEKKIERKLSPQDATWTLIKIRKSDFIREGVDTTKTWANVAAIKIALQGSDIALDVSFDYMQLVGGGVFDQNLYAVSYSYVSQYTLADGSTFFEESSISPEEIITDANRQNIVCTNISDSAETQVTHKNIWIRGGGLLDRYLAGTIAQGTTTFTIDTQEKELVAEPIIDILNNILPPTSPTDVAKSNGRLFVVKNNQIHSSLPLRPGDFEVDLYVSLQGTIKAIMPKTSNLAVLQEDLEQIYVNPGLTVEEGAYLYDAVFPQGCIATRSAVNGFYMAEEGISFFDGAQPQIISDSIGPELLAISTRTDSVADWIRGSYLVCIPNQSIMYEYSAKDNIFLKYDSIKDVTIAARKVFLLKSDGIYQSNADTSSRKAFAFRTHEIILPDDSSFSHLVIDGDLGTAGLTVQYYIDNTLLNTATMTSSGRQTKRMGLSPQQGNRFSVRISSSIAVATNVAIYGIWVQ